MADKALIRSEADRLFARFQEAGAEPVQTAILQPADVLLDLYGEDIRARAYVTNDPVRGEQMLRPDFTVPIVQRHMADGAEPARYTYSGEVFRQQVEGSGRASEYLQVGYELFDRADPAAADAEVFSVFAEALEGEGLTASIGDVGLLIAAVEGLTTSDRRRKALLRHVWRPTRFRALLDRFAGRADAPEGRAELVDALNGVSLREIVTSAGPDIGLRDVDDVAERLAALREDAGVAHIPEGEFAAVLALLQVGGSAESAGAELAEIAKGFPAVEGAVARFVARLDALRARGVNPAEIGYEGSYGLTTLEYYDGFVFGFAKDGGAPVASGGRYDAVTRVLGQGREIPAVGGVIRPALLVEARS